MSNAFTARRPWVAAVMSLILGPFVALLYLGRGRQALAYFVIASVIAIGEVIVLPQFVAPAMLAWMFFLADLPVRLAGTIYVYLQSRGRDAAEPRPWYARWYAVAGFVLVFPVAALTIRVYFLQPFDVRSASGQPTMDVGDYFLVAKRAYDSQPPRRGDLIVFHVPSLGGAAYIKRIVGMPGERIQMRGGILFVNGVPVPQQRIVDYIETDVFGGKQRIAQYRETLPGGHSERILDRGASLFDDTAIFTVPAGAYFVLGDNRDNSDDSRGNEGFVPRDQIVGRVFKKYLSHGHWVWRDVD